MKLTIICLLSCLMQAFQPAPNFEGFKKRIIKYKLPDLARQECNWNYAVVKVTTNSKGIIGRYEVINNCPEYLKKSFDYLKGYKFPANMHLTNSDIVFCLTIENQSENCPVPPEVYHTPSEVVLQVMSDFERQYLKNSKTVFIYSAIMFRFGEVIK